MTLIAAKKLALGQSGKRLLEDASGGWLFNCDVDAGDPRGIPSPSATTMWRGKPIFWALI